MNTRARLNGLGGALALISLATGAGLLVSADFGLPGWLSWPLVVWLVSVGLPTTLAVLGTAALWGTMPPFYGLGPFLLVATLASVTAQVAAVRWLARWRPRSDVRVDVAPQLR